MVITLEHDTFNNFCGVLQLAMLREDSDKRIQAMEGTVWLELDIFLTCQVGALKGLKSRCYH